MDWDQIEGKWKQVKGQAQQQWGDLTDDDLDRVDGKRDRGKQHRNHRDEFTLWLCRFGAFDHV